MATAYTETPDNYSEIEESVITDISEIKSIFFNSNKVLFYDACSFQRHSNLKENEKNILLCYFENHGVAIFLTRCVLMELSGDHHSLERQYVEYINELKDSRVKIVLFNEEYTYNIPIVFPTNGSQAFIARYKGPKYALYNYEMTKSGFKWNFGGTVASLGIDLAYFLEAGKIYLIGSDLAFPNNQNYAEGVAHNTTEGINNTIFTYSVDGGLVATNNVYNEYRKIIERQIAFHPDIPVYNMSRHGADISGTKNIDDIE